MRKQYIETQKIEAYLQRRVDADQQKQFEVQLLVDPSLARETEAQASVHKLVRRFWRRETRKRLENIYQQLLQEPAFAGQLH